MKFKPTFLTVVIPLLTLTAHADPIAELTGDTKLACQAILCLSTSRRPNECTPPIRRYLSIQHRWWSDTVRDRKNFLHMCPLSNSSNNTDSLIDAIANGAGRCDAASLNVALLYAPSGGPPDASNATLVGNQMPDYCQAYYYNPVTNFATNNDIPRYVGVPESGGFWAEAADYDQAVARYNANPPPPVYVDRP